MKERIKKIFEESISIVSFTNTKTERDIEEYIYQYMSEMKYFKQYPNNFGMKEIPNDVHGRRVNWGLVNSGRKQTVILFHHHDTVDIEDYGSLQNIALENEPLKKELLKMDLPKEIQSDICSNEWIFGRGSCDMKASLALQLAVLEEYSKAKNPKVNALYLSVADEESYSQGMRCAITLLAELKEKFDLEYILAIDSEPFESNSNDVKGLHVGTVGKMMPTIVAQGVVSHIKEPLKGINAISLLSRIVSTIDLNPNLYECAKGENSPLPSWSYARDLKEIYDVSTALRAAGYFSVLHLERSPKEIMEIIYTLCEEAIDEFYDNYVKLQDRFCVEHMIAKPKILFFEDLMKLCQEKEGFESFWSQLEQDSAKKLSEGTSYQDITIDNIQQLLEFYGKKEAIIVLAIAAPYYPALSSRNVKNSKIEIEKLVQCYADYLKTNYNFSLNVEEYFMGICDISYCALEKSLKDYTSVMDSMAVSKSVYDIDFENLNKINIPGINLGPWGKDLHKFTERVYEKDVYDTIPNFLLYLLNNIEKIKK